MNWLTIGFVAGTLSAIAGCGPLAATDTEVSSGNACSASQSDAHRVVDPWKELLVTDARVMRSPLARNESRGVLSFAHVADVMGWTGQQAQAWLSDWAPAAATCGWLKARSANACNADCSRCDERRADLSDAPMRLVAVVNRIDMADEVGVGAEGRLVYALTDGSGDDAQATTLRATVIVEFTLRGDPMAWASSWHTLGDHANIDAVYTQSLASLASAFITKDTLAQVRTHNGYAEGSHSMRAFQTANQALAADVAMIPDTHPAACSGCHEADSKIGPGLAFQLEPMPNGELAVSSLLVDSDRHEGDEISRRAKRMQNLLCAN